MCNFEKAPKPKTIAIDLDGTILEYDGWKGHSHFGKPLPGAREALQKLKEEGFVIIIWTTRGDREKVARYLKEQGIPFDYINENPYQPPDSSNKIYADYYVDDRAVEFKGDWQEVLKKVLR
ncbi:Haloacid dehalogenase domain protein hydrolase type 3 [Ferroglobus placidus DSM 10642]|uniref:Haloacid dehalogenase domain protein hydrolase type 3 n=2 Tax=Ferroglobus placidus TaxID=54261 RepID=D3S386_FERPA|nr:Haloacid dehalogenase domain protein hydrolase type 3 [Ferroglobus placidus DSM 10642]